MLKDVYNYIGVMGLYEDDSNGGKSYYGAYIPNFGEVYTSGDTIEEAMSMVTDCLEGSIYYREIDGEELPECINPIDYKSELKDNEFFINITAIMPRVRKAIEQKAIRKNVTMPQWLYREVDRHGLNCSKLLQDAIMVELNIKTEE